MISGKKKIKVLVAEDMELYLLKIFLALTKLKQQRSNDLELEFEMVATAQEVLDRWRAARDTANPFHFILLDNGLDGPMTGAQAARQIEAEEAKSTHIPRVKIFSTSDDFPKSFENTHVNEEVSKNGKMYYQPDDLARVLLKEEWSADPSIEITKVAYSLNQFPAKFLKFLNASGGAFYKKYFLPMATNINTAAATASVGTKDDKVVGTANLFPNTAVTAT